MTEPTHPHPTGACLRCSDLCVNRGGRRVIHNVNMSLRADECVSLIGPNGAGKTTLLLALMGYLPPVAGRVELDGCAMRKLSARCRGRFAAYVPQTVERIPAFTVQDVVSGGRFPHATPLRPLGPTDRTAVADALRLCGLADLASRPVNALSGGERQKTLIAAAIAQDAQVMFLDEPSTALDPGVQLELVKMLRAWHARGRGLILVSHDLHLPATLGGLVIALRAGRVIVDGPAADVLQPDVLADVYQAEFETAVTSHGYLLVLPRWNLD